MSLWTLKKTEGGELYENRSFEEIVQWSRAAQINPFDQLSDDGVHWRKAYEVPALEMHWMALMKDGNSYGPANLSTLKEFLEAGLIERSTVCTHRITNEQTTIAVILDEETQDRPIISFKRPLSDTAAFGKPSAYTLNSLLGATKNEGGTDQDPDIHLNPLPIPPTHPPALPKGAIKLSE